MAMPEQIRAAASGVFAHPMVASSEQPPSAPAGKGGAADSQRLAEGAPAGDVIETLDGGVLSDAQLLAIDR